MQRRNPWWPNRRSTPVSPTQFDSFGLATLPLVTRVLGLGQDEPHPAAGPGEEVVPRSWPGTAQEAAGAPADPAVDRSTLPVGRGGTAAVGVGPVGSPARAVVATRRGRPGRDRSWRRDDAEEPEAELAGGRPSPATPEHQAAAVEG